MNEEAPRLALPKVHKANVMIWADLSVADMDHLDECASADQIKGELTRIFHLETGQDDLKTAILLDLYYYTIQFCRDKNYSKEQTSTLFSIIKNVHQICTETPFENLEYCFGFFKEAILCHAVKRPPFSIDLYTPEQVRDITKYVITTYFRHYKMYKYAFTPLVKLDLSMKYNGIPETPPASEAGDNEGKTEEEEESAEKEKAKEGNETENKETEQEETKKEETTDLPEESPAAGKLRKLIKEELTKEVQNLRQSFDEQLKASENSLIEKISAVDGNQSDKKSKASAKGKKK